MTRSAYLVAVLLAAGLLLAVLAWSADLPDPVGRVNDFADLLSADEEAALQSRIATCEAATGGEIAVVVVQDLPEDISTPKELATELFNKWGVGKKGEDNGVLMLLAVGPRRVEIETGYGVEGLLPDQLCTRLLEDHAVPSFKQGNWGEGLQKALEAVCVVLESGQAYESPTGSSTGETISAFFGILLGLFFGAIFLLPFIIIALVIAGKFLWAKCPNCHARLKYEKTIGNSMVYKCPVCGTTVYRRAMSSRATGSGYSGSSFSSSGSSGGGGGGGFSGGSSGGGGGGASF